MNNFFEDIKSILLDNGFSIEENAIIKFTKEFQIVTNRGTMMINGVEKLIQQSTTRKVEFRMIGEGDCEGEVFDVIEIQLEHDGVPVGGICETFYHNDIPYFEKILKDLLKGY